MTASKKANACSRPISDGQAERALRPLCKKNQPFKTKGHLAVGTENKAG
jgi:hypothetical protein